jgi:ABC-type glutathione transport system ATPase component
MSSLLTARISVDYPNKPGVLRDVQLDISESEILGLVGESGSSKSTIALALLRLLDHKGGSIRGEIRRDLLRLRSGEMRRIRGREIALVLQSPLASLNPALRIGAQISEAWRAHQPGATAKLWKDQALDLFERVNLPSDDAFLALSGPAQRRPSPARPDRHGRSAQTQAADRRRGHKRARRHYAVRNSSACSGA